MPKLWKITAAKNHARIKQFYLSLPRTEQQWQAVSQNPAKFNQVWRKMLGLPGNTTPPPKDYRA